MCTIFMKAQKLKCSINLYFWYLVLMMHGLQVTIVGALQFGFTNELLSCVDMHDGEEDSYRLPKSIVVAILNGKYCIFKK